MSSRQDDDLERIAALICDGGEVDWVAEKERLPDLLGTLRFLRQLEHVARVHGGLNAPSVAGESASSSRVEIEYCKEAAIVRLRGKLIVESDADALSTCIRNLLEQGVNCVVVDLANVTSIDSYGLGVLVAGHVACARRGACLKLCNLADRIKALLSVTRLEAVMDHHKDVQAALASRGKRKSPSR